MLYVYGSSRLGEVDMSHYTAFDGSSSFKTHLRGSRHYELSNHLGNVQMTLSDKKLPHLRRKHECKNTTKYE
jgi:hypothetical protein